MLCFLCVCQLHTFLWSICSGPIRVSPPPTPLYHLSTEKKPCCLGYIGDEILPSDAGDYTFSIIFWIPIKQPAFHGK